MLQNEVIIDDQYHNVIKIMTFTYAQIISFSPILWTSPAE